MEGGGEGRGGEGPCPESQSQKRLAWLLGTPSLACSWWLPVALTMKLRETASNGSGKLPFSVACYTPPFPPTPFQAERGGPLQMTKPTAQ